MTRSATSRGFFDTVFALYEAVLELSSRDVREPNVVVERAEERHAGPDQDGYPGDRKLVDEARAQEPCFVSL